MPRIDHDALFKLLLTAFGREFLDLFAPVLAAQLADDPLIFLDKEQFRSLIDPDRREADIVIQARLRDRPATILVHLEHQAQEDRNLDRRMFRYFARFYDTFDTPIYPIALCSYARPWTHARDRHQLALAERMILDFHYQVVQLNQLDWRAFLQSSNPVAAALMARMRIAPGERWRVKAASLRLLVGIRLTGQQRLLISQFVDLYLPLQRHEEQAFQAEVSTFTPQEQESVMEVVTSWERKGHIKGRAEGRAEGQRQIVEQLLVYKMGQLPEALSQRLVTLTSEQLTSLATALLEFTQLADLEGWLDGQPTAEPPAAGTTPIPTHMDRPKEP